MPDSDVKLVPFSQIEREAVEWLIPGLVPAGMLTVLAGQQGLGKSLLYCAWAKQLADEGKTTIVVNAEDLPTYSTKPRLEALQARDELIVHAMLRPQFGNGNGEHWYREISEWIFSVRARLLILDPLAAFLDTSADVFRDHHVRRILEPLQFVAEASNCAIVYVKHLTKGGDTDPIQRVSDSVAFTAAARSVIVLAREGDYGSLARLVCHAKSNVSELAPIQRWQVVPTLLPARDALPEIKTARIEYCGLAEGLNLYDVLKPPPDSEEETKLLQAEAMIGEMLALGEIPSKDLDSAADAMGISRRTLERARSRLGVRTVQKGRRWMVYLPVGETVTSQTANAQTANEDWRSDKPASLLDAEGGSGFSPPRAGDGGLIEKPQHKVESEQVDFLEWLATARLDEIQERLDTDPPSG